MKVRLTKEPDNDYDKEAIMAEMDGLGKVGYVANNPHAVLGESFSAGRLYDRIADTATGETLYKLPGGILCTLDAESVIYTPPVITPTDELEVSRNFRLHLDDLEAGDCLYRFGFRTKKNPGNSVFPGF